MKWLKWAMALILLSAAAVGSSAWAHRGGARIGLGVMIGPGWGYPYYGPAYPYGPAYYPGYAPAPPVIVQSPPVYLERSPAPAATSYWYYCDSPAGYYPYVKQCPGGWQKVAPQAPEQ